MRVTLQPLGSMRTDTVEGWVLTLVGCGLDSLLIHRFAGRIVLPVWLQFPRYHYLRGHQEVSSKPSPGDSLQVQRQTFRDPQGH
jgi:hypothetical protein